MKKFTSFALASAAIYGFSRVSSNLLNNQFSTWDVILLFLSVVQTILLILNNKEKEITSTTEKAIRNDGSYIPQGRWKKSGVSLYLKQTSHPFLQQLLNGNCLIYQYASELHIYFYQTYVWIKLYDGNVSIEYLTVLGGSRQQGKGTHAMRTLIAAADASKTELTLNTEPQMAPGGKHIAVVLSKDSDDRMPASELPAWFQKFGFIKEPGNETYMKRLPNS